MSNNPSTSAEQIPASMLGVVDYEDEGVELERFIREKECKARTGLSRTTRWRLEQEDKFPKRIQLTTNTVAWRLSDVLDWMQAKIKGGASNHGTA